MSYESRAGRLIYKENRMHEIPGLEKEFNVEDVSIAIEKLEGDVMKVHLSNLPLFFVTAIRSNIDSEVPSMAFDLFEVKNNTTNMTDHKLAHAIAMIPIKADPRMFEYLQEGDERNSRNSIAFTLNIKKSDSPRKIYASDLKLKPVDNPPYSAEDAPAPAYPDILVALLDPGQEIALDAYCLKGCGSDHYKFVPAAAISMHPKAVVELKRRVEGKDAHQLKEVLDDGVIEVKNENGIDVAYVKDSSAFKMSREILRHPTLKDDVEIWFDQNQQILSLEGLGKFSVEDVVDTAISKLLEGVDAFRKDLDNC